MLHVLSSKDVGVGFTSNKLSSKHLKFQINLSKITNDNKLPNKLHININLRDFLCCIFSQDIIYKLNFSKFISKLLMN